MKIFSFVSICLLLFSPALFASEIRLEGGFFQTASNRLNIPNPGGSRVLVRNKSMKPYGRGELLLRVSKNGFIRFMAAPLETNYSYSSATATSFNGVLFPANSPIDITYRFNSYRLGYIYRFPIDESFQITAGLVGKIRQAKVELRSGGLKSTYSNVGFVPLLNLGFRWKLGGPLQLRFDLDGAAAKQGRAFDGSFETFFALSEAGSGLSLGYRILEGGAKNEKVNTFTLLHYAFLGVTLAI